MLTWDDLRYLLAVSRSGSLGGAAKALGLNKSTVSRRISALEDALGVALLERTSRGYELTAAGRSATVTAERIEQLVTTLEDSVGDRDRRPAGIVRVTLPAWFAQQLIIPELPRLRESYPELDVHLVTTDEVLNLAAREADIGIRNVRPTQQSLVARRAGDIAFGMYASREYLQRHGEPAHREDFTGHQLVAYQSAVSHVQAFRWANSLTCPVALRATDATSMLDAVAAGLGIGVLPCFLADQLEGAVCLETLGGRQPEQIWLVSHPDARGIERMRVVMGWLVELFNRKAVVLSGGVKPNS